MSNDIRGLREYAKRYLEIIHSEDQYRKRALWREHNSLNFTKPPIYMRAVPYNEFFDMSLLKCEDPLLRQIEFQLATIVDFHSTIREDSTYYPWVTVEAVMEPFGTRWGVRSELDAKPMEGGAAAFRPAIVDEADIDKIVTQPHRIDEAATAERVKRVYDALGDIIDIHVDKRGALTRVWVMDISTDLAKLRGLEQIMYDAYDRPDWMHRLLTKMRDAILKSIDETEAAGHFTLADHQNQAMTFSKELDDPDCNRVCKTKEMWGYMASQEMTTFGPELFYEFMLQYQMPIMERFGLVAYGCCEDLTQKIDGLRKIPNLRRIAVSPFANVAKCAEQIGSDYILSYRPNPSSMISTGLNEEFVRRTLRADFDVMLRNGCKFDVTLKDVETIAGKSENVIRWVQIAREEIDRAMG